jgi:hypothetical protein
MNLGMQVFEASVKNGVFVEKPIDCIANKRTQVYKADANPSLWYYSLTADIDGDEREVQMAVDSWSAVTSDLYGGSHSEGSVFSGSVTTAAPGSQNMTWTNDLLVGVYANYHREFETESLGNVNLTFASMATSVSRNLRIATTGVAEGTTQELVPHIKAHWLFMLLPSVMVLLTITFVAMVSPQNRRKDVPLW